MPLSLTSPDFSSDGPIPRRCTCDGADTSPALAWTEPPDGAASLALIVDDPDAPDPAAPLRTYVHWVLYDLPPDLDGLPAGCAASQLPPEVRHGLNDWGRVGYGGPCPPIGRHRYFFKLFALDRVLGDLRRPTSAQLQAAMAGHVLDRAELMGTYER